MATFASCPRCYGIDSIIVKEHCYLTSKVSGVTLAEAGYNYVRGDVVRQDFASDYWLLCSDCGATLNIEDVTHVDLERLDIARKIVDKMNGYDLDTLVYNLISSYVERGDVAKLSELMRAWGVKLNV